MLRFSRIAFAMVAVAPSHIAAAPAGAAPASGPKLVPFHATARGTLSFVVIPPTRFVTASGAGQATHLGAVEVAINITASLAPVVVPNCATLGNNEANTTTFTAANGDILTAMGTGSICPTGPTTAASMDSLEVIGGTGRFEGASGAINVRGAIDRATFTFSVSYDGTLSTPGSIK